MSLELLPDEGAPPDDGAELPLDGPDGAELLGALSGAGVDGLLLAIPPDGAA